MNSIRNASLIVDPTGELAVGAGAILARPGKRSKSASLADGMVRATARPQGARPISVARAFAGEPAVSSR